MLTISSVQGLAHSYSKTNDNKYLMLMLNKYGFIHRRFINPALATHCKAVEGDYLDLRELIQLDQKLVDSELYKQLQSHNKREHSVSSNYFDNDADIKKDFGR